jgi:hypothetical protein
VSNNALHASAKRLGFAGTDVGKIFEVHRLLIERVASDAYDANVLDEEGRHRRRAPSAVTETRTTWSISWLPGGD